MSNSIWKTPDQKPDVFKPYTIMVVYEAHDETELMLSTQYEAYTADRYINRWCYLDELLAQANKAERLQKAVDLAVDALKEIDELLSLNKFDVREVPLLNITQTKISMLLKYINIEQITALEQKDVK